MWQKKLQLLIPPTYIFRCNIEWKQITTTFKFFLYILFETDRYTGMESQNCLMILIFIILGGYVIILGGYVIILGAYVFIFGAYSVTVFGAYSIIFGAYVFIFGAYSIIFGAYSIIFGA